MSSIDELLITHGLFRERRPQPLPWMEESSKEGTTKVFTTESYSQQTRGEDGTAQDSESTSEPGTCILKKSTADELLTPFALGELPISDTHRVVSKGSEDKNKVGADKIVNVGLATKPLRYESPQTYRPNVSTDLPMYNYNARNFEQPSKGYFSYKNIHAFCAENSFCGELKATLPSPLERGRTVETRDKPVVIQTLPPVDGRDTSIKRSTTNAKANSDGLSKTATFKTSKCFEMPPLKHTQYYKLDIIANQPKHSLRKEITVQKGTGVKQATQIGHLNNNLIVNNPIKPDNVTVPSPTDSDTDAMVEEILAITKELSSSEFTITNDHKIHTKQPQTKVLNKQFDGEFDDTLSKILDMSDAEKEYKQNNRSKVTGRNRRKAKRGVRCDDGSPERSERDKERQKKGRNISNVTKGQDCNVDVDGMLTKDFNKERNPKPTRTKNRGVLRNKRDNESKGNDSDDAIDAILKATDTGVYDKQLKKSIGVNEANSNLVSKRNLSFPNNDVEKSGKVCATRKQEALTENKSKDRFNQNKTKQSTRIIIDPEEVKRKNRRKKLELDLRSDRNYIGCGSRKVNSTKMKENDIAPKANVKSDTETEPKRKKKIVENVKQCYKSTNTYSALRSVEQDDTIRKSGKKQCDENDGNESLLSTKMTIPNVEKPAKYYIIYENVKANPNTNKVGVKNKCSYNSCPERKCNTRGKFVKVFKRSNNLIRTQLSPIKERKENAQTNTIDMSYESSSCCPDDDYIPDSPIPWIRSVSPDLESRDFIFPMPEPDIPYEDANNKTRGQAEGVKRENAQTEIIKEKKTKRSRRIRKLFRRLLCCIRPEIED